MRSWQKQPTIYEINTWVWLNEMRRKYGRHVTLQTVPQGEWDAVAAPGMDAVWLMGIWERSPAGARIAREEPALREAYLRALPDCTPEDVVGSAYCIHRYVADGCFGGAKGLAAAREMLAERGLRLILDFVPNHVAVDHPWVFEHPEYFIQGEEGECMKKPGEFFAAGGNILAHGRDPCFPPWTDTAQLNAFHAGLRRAVVETLCSLAAQCDGVRCDMAMLLISRIFQETWGTRAGSFPASEFWEEVIGSVRAKHPGFMFLAEAYWDLEWELQQQGFDYCYDKRLYDRLVHENAESVRGHLLADVAYQAKLVRFLENHDEPRAAAIFHPKRLSASAVVTFTLPGARLFHEGQFEGRRVKLPVQLGRRPDEPVDSGLRSFYERLLQIIGAEPIKEGEWRLCDRRGWPDNAGYLHLTAWCWRKGGKRSLVVVNLSDARVQGRILVPWDDIAGTVWQLSDAFTGAVYERSGEEMRDPGLFVDLEPWSFHVLSFENRVKIQ